MAPEFSEAARIIAITDPSIKLAKVKIDVTEETFLADFYNVTAYPTLLFCKENGEFGIPELIKYDGVRTADSIISRVKENGPMPLAKENGYDYQETENTDAVLDSPVQRFEFKIFVRAVLFVFGALIIICASLYISREFQ